MKRLTHNCKTFLLDGKPAFLNAGEIQYFRISRDLWRTHLQKAKDAGLNAVSTYIPWDWHEEKEGQFDFEGKTHPQKDLLHWLDLCKEFGLMAIVKPGPVILAEYRGAGIPFWFIEKHGEECLVKNSLGSIGQLECMTFMHPTYLELTMKWYDQVIPLLAERQVSQGGAVSMLQVCNEVGVFTWLAHQGDYASVCIDSYRQFLKDSYEDIDALNSVYQEYNHSFVDVIPPSDTKKTYDSRAEWAKDQDWHSFWRRYYGDYLRLLMKELRRRGIDVPFYHNLPGWIYGSGWEFPLNITMYSDLYDENYPEIIFGVDHIPEYMSYRNAHDDRIINDITLAMQGGGPLFSAEFQSGSREYHVVPTPREMSLFYKASLSHGLVGWNYYMFSQGKNQCNRGYSGQTFYWFTPLDANAEESSAYPLVKDTNALVNTLEPIILESERRAKIAVAFYAPYYGTELEKIADLGKCDMKLQPSHMRKVSYFDGLLKIFNLLNIDYDTVDLQRTSLAEMQNYDQMWVFSVDFMDELSQQKVVDYMAAGGQAVIFPTFPTLNLKMKQCTLMSDALKMDDADWTHIDSPLVDVLERQDVKCHNPLRVFPESTLDRGGKVIARTPDQQICALQRDCGKGSGIVLGFSLSFETEDHRWVYEDLLKLSGTRLSSIHTDSKRLLVQQRFSKDSGLLFVGNYYNEEEEVSLTYTHPIDASKVAWPYAVEKVLMPQTYAVLSPLHLEILSDLFILHSTSDLLGIDKKDSECILTVKGDRDLLGELVFEGEKAKDLGSVMINGEKFILSEKNRRYYVHYNHAHNESLTILFRYPTI
jgi:beta-galactosidase